MLPGIFHAPSSICSYISFSWRFSLNNLIETWNCPGVSLSALTIYYSYILLIYLSPDQNAYENRNFSFLFFSFLYFFFTSQVRITLHILLLVFLIKKTFIENILCVHLWVLVYLLLDNKNVENAIPSFKYYIHSPKSRQNKLLKNKPDHLITLLRQPQWFVFHYT